MDPANAREALREAALDEAEGADMLMVKPALSYLDVIRDVRAHSNLPLGAYNVSGEYSMLHAAADRGMIDRDRAMMEVLTSIRRAGADFILTYHALGRSGAARWLNAGELRATRVVAVVTLWVVVMVAVAFASGCYGHNCDGNALVFGRDPGEGRLLEPRSLGVEPDRRHLARLSRGSARGSSTCTISATACPRSSRPT